MWRSITVLSFRIDCAITDSAKAENAAVKAKKEG
jgi:hypothetical protein